MKELSFPLYRLMVTGQGNTPNVPFPGNTSDYITIHMTGNRAAGADASAHALWMKTNAPYSWHVTVDDVEAWQSIEWWMQGWHAGDGVGKGNRESIGIEICMYTGINQIAAYEKAAELTAALLIEGHGRLGVVQHNFWTGKDCPELIRAEEGRWAWFLIRVEQHRRRLAGELEDDMSPEDKALLDKLVKVMGNAQMDEWLAKGNNPLLTAFASEQTARGEATNAINGHLENHPAGGGAAANHKHRMDIVITETGPVI